MYCVIKKAEEDLGPFFERIKASSLVGGSKQVVRVAKVDSILDIKPRNYCKRSRELLEIHGSQEITSVS